MSASKPLAKPVAVAEAVVLEDNPVAAPPVASVPGTQLEPSHFNTSPT